MACTLFSKFWQKAAVVGYLARTNSPISRVQLTGSASFTMTASTSMPPGTAQGTCVATAPSSLGQGSHNFDDLLFQFSCSLHLLSGHCSLGPYSILGLLIFALSLASSHHPFEYITLGVMYRYWTKTQICFLSPWKRWPWRWCWASRSIHFSGHWSWIWFRVPSNPMANEDTLLLFSWLALYNFASSHWMKPLCQNNQ